MTAHCLDCGSTKIAKPSREKDRSTPQLRRFFAIVKAAFIHWPERTPSEFRPKSAEHLRYWLEMKADYFTVTTMARISRHDPGQTYELVRAFLKHSEDERLFLELDGNLLIEKRTKSIDYDTLDSSAFSKLKDAVCDVIKAETGMEAEQLLRETERAA